MKYGLVLVALLMAGCSNASDDAVANAQEQAIGQYDNIDAANAQDFIIAHPDAIVMDVRRPEEFSEGHVAGAINIDYHGDDFRDQLAKLDKDAHYVLHCKSGNRSGKSVEIMKELGFQRVTHMDGGFDAWKAAELPSVSG